MSSNKRREFLKQLGVGSVGLAGLLLPSQTYARGGRRGVYCCPQDGPVYGNVTINYPTASAQVPGGGRFFSWGTVLSGYTVRRVVVNDPNNPVGNSELVPDPPPGGWGARHWNIPTYTTYPL